MQKFAENVLMSGVILSISYKNQSSGFKLSDTINILQHL